MGKKKKKSSGTTIKVEGGIHAGRDAVMGDVTYKNYTETHIQNIRTPKEFTAALDDLQTQIAALKQQPGLTAAQSRNLEVAEQKVSQAAQMAQQPGTSGESIRQTVEAYRRPLQLP